MISKDGKEKTAKAKETESKSEKMKTQKTQKATVISRVSAAVTEGMLTS